MASIYASASPTNRWTNITKLRTFIHSSLTNSLKELLTVAAAVAAVDQRRPGCED